MSYKPMEMFRGWNLKPDYILGMMGCYSRGQGDEESLSGEFTQHKDCYCDTDLCNGESVNEKTGTIEGKVYESVEVRKMRRKIIHEKGDN